MPVATEQLVERIWERDSTVWTGSGEEKWLGWLDEPQRMRERIGDLQRFADEVGSPGVIDTFVLLGMGGSSLAPIVLKQSFGGGSLEVLDTTHPAMIRRSAEMLDLDRTLFIASSKSGTTLETRSHLDFFWERNGGRGEFFVAITDPGSELEGLARERDFLEVFAGEPTIGGRYSALSPFGMVPAAARSTKMWHFDRLLVPISRSPRLRIPLCDEIPLTFLHPQRHGVVPTRPAADSLHGRCRPCVINSTDSTACV